MEPITPAYIIDDEDKSEDLGLPKQDEESDSQSDELATAAEQKGSDEMDDDLEVWDDVGRRAIAIGSKLIKRESDIIRKACGRINKRRSKRKREGPPNVVLPNKEAAAVQADQAERRSVTRKLKRLQRLTQMLYNLDLSYRHIRSDIEAIANEEDSA